MTWLLSDGGLPPLLANIGIYTAFRCVVCLHLATVLNFVEGDGEVKKNKVLKSCRCLWLAGEGEGQPNASACSINHSPANSFGSIE